MGDLRVRCVKVHGHPETKKLMDEAFKGLTEEELSPVWYTEDKCFSVKQKEKNTFYIFDVFEGDAFAHITSLGCRVLGPLCILTSLTCKTDIPRRHEPVYNLAMKGVVICCTNINKEEREPIHKKALLMGGEVSKALTAEVTHLIAGAVGSNKYLVAASSGRQVMVPQWINAVWEKSKLEAVHGLDEQFQEYKCPVFLGQVMTVSGLSSDERKETKRLIEKEGGKYSGEMKLQECTHLITNEPKGQKYMFAMKWKIAIVRSEWLYDSIEKGFCQDEKLYQTGGTAEENKGQMKTSTPERKSMPGNMGDISNISMISMAAVNETANVTNMTTAETTRLDDMDPMENLDVSKMPADLFLDGCKIYLSGFRGSSLEKLRKIINSGGGTRSNQISDNLTHIVVGEKIPADIEQIKKLTSHPHAVTSQWLVNCFKQGTLLPETHFLSSELPAFKPTTPKAKGLNKKQRSSTVGEKPSTSRQSMKPEAPVIEEGEEMDDILSQYMDNPAAKAPSPSNDTTLAPPDDEAMTQDPSDVTAVGEDGVFSKKTFVFYGFEEEQIPVFASFIKENGGTMLQMNARRIPDYAVVPMNGFPVDRTVGDIVTNAWLQMCIEKNCLLDLSSNSLFTPIEINIDSNPLQTCVLSISGFQGTERDCLSHIAEALGARIQEYFVRDATKNGLIPNTHLLVNAPEGSKYNASRKWGIPAVSNKWLLDCARLGQLLPVEEYDIAKVQSMPTDPVNSRVDVAKSGSAVDKKSAQNPVCSEPAQDKISSDSDNVVDRRRSVDQQKEKRNSVEGRSASAEGEGNKLKRQSGAIRTEESAISLPDFSTTGDTEALLLDMRSQQDGEVTIQDQGHVTQAAAQDEDDEMEVQFNVKHGKDEEIMYKAQGDGDRMEVSQGKEEVTFKGQGQGHSNDKIEVSGKGDNDVNVCDNKLDQGEGNREKDSTSTRSESSACKSGEVSTLPKHLSKVDTLKNSSKSMETPPLKRYIKKLEAEEKMTSGSPLLTKASIGDKLMAKGSINNNLRAGDCGAQETPPLKRYIKNLEAEEEMTSGSPLLTKASIRDKLMAKYPNKSNWRTEDHGTKQPSHSQKENLVTMSTPVQSRVKELKKMDGGTSDKDTPSKFLNPDVRYFPKFDTDELMKALETPEDVRAARKKRRSSLPFDELFELKMAKAQQTIQQAKERKLEAGLPMGSQYDEVDGEEEMESDVLNGVVITVAKKLVKDQGELNDIVASLGGDYRWNYDTSCTHLIFQGRQNDTAKDFRMARTHNLKIVSPHWLYMCKEQNAHVDESLFPHTFNPNLSLSVVSTRRTPMRTPGRASRRNMRGVNSKPATSTVVQPPETATDTDINITPVRVKTVDKDDVQQNMETKDKSPAAPVVETDVGGSLEMREVLSRQLEDVMAESKGRLRRKSKRLNSSGQISTPEDPNSSARRRTQESLQKSAPRTLRNTTADKEEKSSADIGPSQSVHVVWDDPMGRMEQEKLAAMLERANSPTQEVDGMHDDIPADAQYSDTEPDNEVPIPPFQEHQNVQENTPKVGKKNTKKIPTPEGPSIAFPTSNKAMKITPPKAVLISDEGQEESEKSPPIFMMSVMTQPEKDDYGALIEQLGGRLLDAADFDPKCTHLVVGNINRNEKILASIASGKWVLHKSYLEACRQEQKFVNEDFYEWGSEGTLSLVRNMDSNVRLLAAAARDWRIKVQQKRPGGSSKVGAFCSWRVILCTDEKKEGNYKRLLEAGGATIINKKQPFSGKVDATHAFLELNKVSLTQDDLEVLVTSGCQCMKPSYICTYLSDPNSDSTNQIIPEVAALAAVLTGESVTGKKRKASTGETAPKRSKRR